MFMTATVTFMSQNILFLTSPGAGYGTTP